MDVTASFTRPNDTTPYAVGDVVGAVTSGGVARQLDLSAIAGGGLLRHLRRLGLTSSVNSATWRPRLYLFNANPSASTTNDNAALSIAAADRSKLIAIVGLDALANVGAISAVENPYIDIDVALANKILYVVVTTDDVFTPTAQATYTVEASFGAASD